MRIYSDEEKAQIVRQYQASNFAMRETQRALRRDHDLRPDHKTIRRIYDNFLSKGIVTLRRGGSRRSIRTTRNIRRVREAAQNAQEQGVPSSIRNISRQLEIPSSSVRRILRNDLRFKPYHNRPVHFLRDSDFPRRVTMAEKLLSLKEEDESFFKKIIFSDEARFSLNPVVNTHNEVYWCRDNPHIETAVNALSQEGLMVWCGVWAGGKIGPYFFSGRVNAKSYLEMIQRYVVGRIPAEENLWFMQDGAPSHTARAVRRYLNAQYPNRWIGLHGPVEWSPRSPDMNVCDFFLWGFLMSQIWARRPKPQTLEQLKTAIIEEFERIPQEMIADACESVEERCFDLIRVEGRSIQHEGGR